MAGVAAQPSAAHAVLLDKDLAPLVLQPLLVTGAAWTTLDAAKAVARVECVCRALRRAAEPLWRTLVVQRWPSAALEPQRGEGVPRQPRWSMLYRQRHVAALRAPRSDAVPRTIPALRRFQFSLELTLDGQPFASTLFSHSARGHFRGGWFDGDHAVAFVAEPAAGAPARTSRTAAPQLHATLFAQRPCEPADHRSREQGTAYACLFSNAAAVQQPANAPPGVGAAPGHERAMTVEFHMPLRRNDTGYGHEPLRGNIELLLRLQLRLAPPPPAAGEVPADDEDVLQLRDVLLEFFNRPVQPWRHPHAAPQQHQPHYQQWPAHPDSVQAALWSLQWEGEHTRPRLVPCCERQRMQSRLYWPFIR